VLAIAHSSVEIEIITLKSERLPMALHPSLVPEATAVVGDIDELIAYIESGEAENDWHERRRYQRQQFEDVFCALSLLQHRRGGWGDAVLGGGISFLPFLGNLA
jgi:hypothetical protein